MMMTIRVRMNFIQRVSVNQGTVAKRNMIVRLRRSFNYSKLDVCVVEISTSITRAIEVTIAFSRVFSRSGFLRFKRFFYFSAFLLFKNVVESEVAYEYAEIRRQTLL